MRRNSQAIGGCGGIKSREKPTESHKVDPAASSWTANPHSLLSVRFERELFRFQSAQRLQDIQVAHVTGSV